MRRFKMSPDALNEDLLMPGVGLDSGWRDYVASYRRDDRAKVYNRKDVLCTMPRDGSVLESTEGTGSDFEGRENSMIIGRTKHLENLVAVTSCTFINASSPSPRILQTATLLRAPVRSQNRESACCICDESWPDPNHR